MSTRSPSAATLARSSSTPKAAIHRVHPCSMDRVAEQSAPTKSLSNTRELVALPLNPRIDMQRGSRR
jgi:hypothetical protein